MEPRDIWVSFGERAHEDKLSILMMFADTRAEKLSFMPRESVTNWFSK
jgi:hypothetical protein